MSPAVCPACGSPSTYVRKRDGELCCKTCGHGVKHRGGPEAVQHECPLCRSKQVYLRTTTQKYACRRCGLGQDGGIKPEYLAEMAERVRTDYRGTRTMPPCPICGGALAPLRGDNVALCSTCGFNTGLHPALRPSFLAALPPFREIRRDPPSADLPASRPPRGPVLVINGRRLSLKREAGAIWVVVDPPAAGFPFAGPGPYPIPIYDTDQYSDFDSTDPLLIYPETVAEAWKRVLTRAKIGRDNFLEEFPGKLDGLTPAQMTAMQAAGLLSPKAREKVLLAFREETLPGPTTSIDYAAMAFEIGLLDRLDEEIEAVRVAMTQIQQADDDDEIPPGGEENLYYSVPVPDDLPPVDEVQISFDGGKTVWGFVASRLQGRE